MATEISRLLDTANWKGSYLECTCYTITEAVIPEFYLRISGIFALRGTERVIQNDQARVGRPLFYMITPLDLLGFLTRDLGMSPCSACFIRELVQWCYEQQRRVLPSYVDLLQVEVDSTQLGKSSSFLAHHRSSRSSRKLSSPFPGAAQSISVTLRYHGPHISAS
jgi:hypothetical protein